jgi:ferredoxin
MSNEGAASARYRVLLRPSGRSFAVAADQTLLAGALAAGIALPSSCRNGTCRTCLRPLHAGRVHYRIAWPGLTPEERNAGGWVLPCVAYPLSDVVLDEPESAAR